MTDPQPEAAALSLPATPPGPRPSAAPIAAPTPAPTVPETAAPTARPTAARGTPLPRVQRAEHGLTAPGVAVVVLAGSLVGLLIDAFTIDSGTIFGVAYVASCVYAALQVRRRDLLAAVVVPPLVFLVLTVGELLFNGTGGGLSDRVLDLVSELATHAPALWTGTVLAAIIVGVRWKRR